MSRALLALGVLSLVLALPSATGKVVNGNTDDLPPGCERVADDVRLTVRGGRNHSHAFPGTLFVFDDRSWDLPACARVTVTFVNDDPIRHQFMVHGTWPEGFTLIEVDGPGEETGTFILPPRAATLLVHCGVSQHQQKGMKAQILVEGGIGDLPNIPGISGIPPPGAGDASAARAGEQEGNIPAPSSAALAAMFLAALALAARHGR